MKITGPDPNSAPTILQSTNSTSWKREPSNFTRLRLQLTKPQEQNFAFLRRDSEKLQLWNEQLVKEWFSSDFFEKSSDWRICPSIFNDKNSIITVEISLHGF